MEDESDDFDIFEAILSSPSPSTSSSTDSDEEEEVLLNQQIPRIVETESDEEEEVPLFQQIPRIVETNSDEEEEDPLNQQIPRIAETNSVTGDSSRSYRDLNGNGEYEPSTSHWRDRPSTDGSSTDSDDPMETDQGDSSSLLRSAIEKAQRWSPPLERANEEISTVQRRDWGHPLHLVFGMEPRETVEALCSRAEAFIQELLHSLLLSRSDYPAPPGRLPVSISPESSSPSEGIQLKINLKNRTSSIVQGKDIPPRFRNENDRNKGLPTMDVSVDSIQGAFDRACDHFSFWLTRLIKMIDDENGGDEAIEPENYYPTFELFQKEFLDFDEMVTFALKRLRRLVGLDVIEALNERHKDVQKKYWKLEVAVLTGRFKDQEGYISNVADDIENVLRSLWSIYTTD